MLKCLDRGARGSHQKPQAALYFLVLAEAPYGPCGYIWHRAPMTCSSACTGGQEGATKNRKRPLYCFIVLAQVPYGPCSYGIGPRWHAQVFGQVARGSHQKPQAAFIFFYRAGTGPIWAMSLWHRAPMACSSVWTGDKGEPPKTAKRLYSFV